MDSDLQSYPIHNQRGSQLLTTIQHDGLVETVVMRAKMHARDNGHNSMMGAEYLVLSILELEEFRGVPYFGLFGIESRTVSASIKLIAPYANHHDEVEPADCFSHALTVAEEVTHELGGSSVGSLQLAYGITSVDEKSLAYGIMNKNGIDVRGMRSTVRILLEEVVVA